MFGRLVLVGVIVAASWGSAAAESGSGPTFAAGPSDMPGVASVPLLDGGLSLSASSEKGATMYRVDADVLAPLRGDAVSARVVTQVSLSIIVNPENLTVSAATAGSLTAQSGQGSCVTMTFEMHVRVSPDECVET